MSTRPPTPSGPPLRAPVSRTYAAVLAVEVIVVGLLWVLQQIFA
jgi:hypothetical protein